MAYGIWGEGFASVVDEFQAAFLKMGWEDIDPSVENFIVEWVRVCSLRSNGCAERMTRV